MVFPMSCFGYRDGGGEVKVSHEAILGRKLREGFGDGYGGGEEGRLGCSDADGERSDFQCGFEDEGFTLAMK